MRSFAHHHTDTPHGESHPPFPLSVLLTALFVGAQMVVWVSLLVTTPMREDPFNIYRSGSPVATVSAVITLLLLGYLAVDLRRHRIEAHGRKLTQYVVFAAALALLAAFGLFLIRAM